MKTANKVKGTAVSMPVGVATGTLVSLLTTGGASGLLTWLILNGKAPEASTGYITMGILLMSTILGTLLSAAKIKRRWMLVSCITGMLYFLALLSCTAIFFGGNYQGVGVSALVVLVGSLLTGFVGLKREKGHSRGVKKYRAR